MPFAQYKTLEAMVREVKTDSSNSVSAALVQEKTEKSTMRTRGSSSPFRCIAGLVQQMNMEKDQELSMARLHIEELEELAANRQKEVNYLVSHDCYSWICRSAIGNDEDFFSLLRIYLFIFYPKSRITFFLMFFLHIKPSPHSLRRILC